MLTSLLNWWRGAIRRRRAIQTAARSVTRDRGVRAYMVSVIHEDDTRTVVRVCFGETMPPQRVWVGVPHHEGTVEELDWHDAQRIGETPWR